MKSNLVALTENLLVHEPATKVYPKGQVFDLSLDSVPEIIRQKVKEGSKLVVKYERPKVASKPEHTVVSPGQIEIQGGLKEFVPENSEINPGVVDQGLETDGPVVTSDNTDDQKEPEQGSPVKIKLKT